MGDIQQGQTLRNDAGIKIYIAIDRTISMMCFQYGFSILWSKNCIVTSRHLDEKVYTKYTKKLGNEDLL